MDIRLAHIRENLKDHLPALAIAAVIIVASIVVPRLLNRVPQADVAGFERDCVGRVLKDNDILPACTTEAAIYARYRLDAWDLMVALQGRRILTAQRMANGEIPDAKTYQACLDSGDCAPVPVLTGIDPKSPEGVATRAEFWYLVRHGGITAAACRTMDLCQALVKLDLMKTPQPVPRGP